MKKVLILLLVLILCVATAFYFLNNKKYADELTLYGNI